VHVEGSSWQFPGVIEISPGMFSADSPLCCHPREERRVPRSGFLTFIFLRLPHANVITASSFDL